MSDLLFGLVSTYGLTVIAASAFLSCLMFPIPTFAVMLAGGAFAGSGDLVLWQVLVVAFAAAVSGDQTGFMIGRMGGPAMIAALNQHPGRAAIIERARTTLQRWGPLGVFFSTWLVAPLGPWVNLIAGATGLAWWRFAIWDAAGEAIWVTIYVSLGFAFGTNLEALTDVVGNWAGFISAATIAIAVGLFLFTQVRKRLS